MLGHRVGLCLTLSDTTKLLYDVAVLFDTPTRNTWGSRSPVFFQHPFECHSARWWMWCVCRVPLSLTCSVHSFSQSFHKHPPSTSSAASCTLPCPNSVWSLGMGGPPVPGCSSALVGIPVWHHSCQRVCLKAVVGREGQISCHLCLQGCWHLSQTSETCQWYGRAANLSSVSQSPLPPA